MTPRFRIDPKSAVPIWHQIEELMRRLVATGALAPGAAAPSVRELAQELIVNPATVAKAYTRLTDAGIFVVRRGEGTFVAEQPPQLPAAEKRRALTEAAERYATAVAELGVDKDEAIEAVRKRLEEER